MQYVNEEFKDFFYMMHNFLVCCRFDPMRAKFLILKMLLVHALEEWGRVPYNSDAFCCTSIYNI